MKQKKSKHLWNLMLILAMTMAVMIGMTVTAWAESSPPTTTVLPANSGSVNSVTDGGSLNFVLTATPGNDYEFEKWTYNLSGEPKESTENPLNVGMNVADTYTNVIANFNI